MQNKEQEPQTFGPAPVDPNTAYPQQPVNQQYFAQPQGAPVQYVVMAQSLKGVRGWLLTFAIFFGLAGLGYITTFFQSMTDLSSASSIVSLIFAPLLAAAFITATVFIAMEKKLGKWLSIGALGLSALYSIVNAIAKFAAGESSSSAPALISLIITNIVVAGLLMLYFFVSRRVKETLVK